jgi:hypothetical protein
MKVTNSEVEILMNGLSHMSIDYEGKTQRKLPLLASVRVSRTLEKLRDIFKPVQEAREKLQERRDEKQEELREKLLDEESDYTEKEFESDLNDYLDELNEEFEGIMEKEISVQFEDLVTMEDLQRIDKTLDEGVPSGVSQAVILIEDLHKRDNNDSDS